MHNKKVLILLGSDSDFAVMKEAGEVLKSFEVGFDLRVLSVHRAPDEALEAARAAEKEGYRVIIAAAGQAAHLAGAMAAHTVLPVIGVPMDSGPLRGVDALYSTVMMPPGVPVAAMAIGGSRNAALLALQILGTSDEALRGKLRAYKASLAEGVRAKDKKIQEELKK